MRNKRIEHIHAIAQYLLKADANESLGKPITEIREATGIGEKTLRNLLNTTVGFDRSKSPVWPYGYWCNLTTFQLEPEPTQKIDNNTGLPKNNLGVVEAKVTFDSLQRTISTDEMIEKTKQLLNSTNSELLTYFDLLKKCQAVSQDFVASGGTLDLSVYQAWNTAANELRVRFEHVLKSIATYQDDPRLSTPEYWSVFLK